MKITYFGTGGGAGVPEIFCSCRVCEVARQRRGRDIRTRSQAAINDDLIIDFPVDTFLHTLHGGLDMRKYHHVLITHTPLRPLPAPGPLQPGEGRRHTAEYLCHRGLGKTGKAG